MELEKWNLTSEVGGVELGFGLFVLFFFVLFLLIMITFGLSFVKQRHVSTIGFMFFIMLSIFFSFSTVAETNVSMSGGMLLTSRIDHLMMPILFGILSIIAAVLWLCSKKKLARGLGVFSLVSMMYLFMQI